MGSRDPLCWWRGSGPNKKKGAELEVGDLNMQSFSLSVTRNEHIL